MPTDPVFVAGDYKNIIFFLFPREITVMRDSSRDFSLENTIFFIYQKRKKERKKGKKKKKEKKEFYDRYRKNIEKYKDNWM